MGSSHEQLLKHIEEYVTLKHISGITFGDGEGTLKRFAKYCKPLLQDKLEITKVIMDGWVEKRAHETTNTRKIRVNYVVPFLGYLSSMGVLAYIPAPIKKSQTPYVPHIFTDDELARFFSAASNIDQFPNCKGGVHAKRPLVMGVIFKVIYACGLRLSEAIQLRVQDVDLTDGILVIRQSKLDKDRLVPIHTETLILLRKYRENSGFASALESPFFPNHFGGFYADVTIYSAFRKILWAARIPHGGRGKGPRIHDFRHTFAVHCLKNWVLNGSDITAALPYLSAYMGHVSISSSQYYLRLTSELYPNISSKMETMFDVLPNLEVLYEAI